MKILMFGRGVISTQYAWAFEKAGHTVEFYVRKGRKAEWGSTVALHIFDARKKIRGVKVQENWSITMVEDFAANHNYDLILVSVQHYHIKNVVDFLADRIGKATVLMFNNFWEEPQEAVAKLPESQLVWGFPQAGGGFDEKGVLNGSLFGVVQFGTFGTAQTARGLAVMDLFKSAGFKINEFKDFRAYLLPHFVFNAAIQLEILKTSNGLASLNDLQMTSFWRNVIQNGKALLPLLEARKVDFKASSEWKMFRLPPWILSFLMRGIIKFMPPIKQIFIGHSNLDELKSYCQDVLQTANDLKIPLPSYEVNRSVFEKEK
jgi:2-dehydropantoate 2-reductase